MNTVLEAPLAGIVQSSLNKQEVGTVLSRGGRVLVGDEIKSGNTEVIRSLPF